MLNDFREKFANIATNGVNVPLSSNVIEQLIRRKSGTQDVTVEITKGYLRINGTTEVKKMMLKKNVSFSVKLKPIEMDKRTIKFEIIEMKPFNINFINSKIFNKPPFLEYTDRTIKVDFNVWDAVKKIPVGNIKSYEMIEGAINIKMSL